MSQRGQRGQGGTSRGVRGDGQPGPSRGRGDGDRGHNDGGRGGRGGGPPGRGQHMQMTSRPAPERGAIYLSGQDIPGLDAKIHETEDALVLHTKDQTIDGFPGRPGYGTKGKETVMRTNYFKITTKYEDKPYSGDDKLFRYDISISPEPTRPTRRRFVEEILKDSFFDGIHWATDYGMILVTTSQLSLGQHGQWTKKITLASPDGSAQSPQHGALPRFVQQAQQRNTATVKITLQGNYSLRILIDHLRSLLSGAQYVGGDNLIQLLNIIVCTPPQASPTVANVGANKFYPFHGDTLTQIFDLGGGLQALRGYFSSVRPAVGRLLLNLNVVSGAFYEPIALISLLNRAQGSHEEQEQFLFMLKVKVTYVKGGQSRAFMTKTKTIVGLAGQVDPRTRVKRFYNAREATFKFTNTSRPNAIQQTITVYDYFQQHHNITLQKPNLPVLNVGTRIDPQYIPQELCTVLPGQPYRKLLPAEQTSQMITVAARPPNANAISIVGTPGGDPGHGLQLFRLAAPTGQPDPQPTSVRPFGFRVGTEMITVPARILDSPTLAYRGAQKARINRGTWNLQGVKFLHPGKFDGWQVIGVGIKELNGLRRPLVGRPTDGEMLEPNALIQRFASTMAKYGIQMGERGSVRQIELEDLTKANRAKNNKILANLFENAKTKDRKQVLLIILSKYDGWLYTRIKYYGDVEYGIHTINAIGQKLQKPKGQGMYLGNLALKFNVKGGGVSHEVANTLEGAVGKNTIIFGIDVTHPSPGSSKGAPSIACVVANTDAYLFQWPGSIRPQTSRKEMVENLKQMVLERLDLWRKCNGNRLPDKVIIYRDGVSEGQFKTVLEQELPYFHQAYAERYGDNKSKWPKTAIIICGKRHHTRFYPTKETDADTKSLNPLPGTIVDRGIVGRIILPASTRRPSRNG